MSDESRQLLRKRRLPNMSSYAWLLLPLLAAVVGLIVLFHDPDSPAPAPLEIVERSAAGAKVYMAGPAASNGSWDSVPVSGQSRQKVFENLRDFRAVYKQASVQMSVVPAGEGAREVARRLGSALSHYALGGVGDADSAPAATPPGVEDLPPVMLLFCAERDSGIALELLAALEPYLAGPVTLVWDDALRIDQLRLEIRGVPRFADNGEALFAAGAFSAPP